MSVRAKLRTGPAIIVAAAAVVAVAGLLFTSGARTEELKHYDSSKKDFWLHPPDDWFMGDETQEQKGTHVLNTLPPPTGFTKEEIEATAEADQAAARLQDRAVGDRPSTGAADGLGRQGHAVRRLVPGQGRVRGRRRRRQEDGQDCPQGPDNADRHRLPGWRALRRRHQQDLQVRKCRGEPRQDAGAADRL